MAAGRPCLVIATLLGAVGLAGCQQAKSVDWYKAHRVEAEEVETRCLANGSAGEDCGNAAIALKALRAEDFARAQEATAKKIEDGSMWPGWNGKNGSGK